MLVGSATTSSPGAQPSGRLGKGVDEVALLLWEGLASLLNEYLVRCVKDWSYVRRGDGRTRTRSLAHEQDEFLSHGRLREVCLTADFFNEDGGARVLAKLIVSSFPHADASLELESMDAEACCMCMSEMIAEAVGIRVESKDIQELIAPVSINLCNLSLFWCKTLLRCDFMSEILGAAAIALPPIIRPEAFSV